MSDYIESFKKLKAYCEAEQFKGWDPFDGLNSRIFQATPLKKSWFFRLAIIQLFKRNPYNWRKLFLIDKGFNPKGIGLFLMGYCYLYELLKDKPQYEKEFGSIDDCLKTINYLAELLITLRSEGYAGACWGYNFDWQRLNTFFFPKGTPTVVATCFCSTALMEAYEVTGNKEYLEVALTSADFVIKDLHRTEYGDGFFFSYSPQNVNGSVINASLLGTKLLSYCYKYTQNEEYKELARKSVCASVKAQNDDGSWVYGLLDNQGWKDSFHTGYNLDGIYAYQEITGDNSFNNSLNKGLEYYVKHFFENGIIPKYYDNQMYPIDIHCPAQFIVTLARMGQLDEYRGMVDGILNWMIKNMQDKKDGYFYYQLKKGISSKISYMRWSNAFVFNMYALYFREIK